MLLSLFKTHPGLRIEAQPAARPVGLLVQLLGLQGQPNFTFTAPFPHPGIALSVRALQQLGCHSRYLQG